MEVTENQVIQLSPDTASTKAGKKLATPSKWVKRFIHEKAIWGACQGSGKNPYTTMIDTTNLAFKCSCPSRKFPCKHSLGLLFLYAQSPDIFQEETELAEHVAEWIGKREAKEEKKATKVDKPVDEKAQQKRIAKRIKKMDAGIVELSLWLKDLVRTGIMNVPQQAYTFTKNIAARMVDAQVPGIATKLQALSQINFYEEGWQTELLRQVSKLYLLTSAYEQRAKLSEAWQAEIKAQIGWNIAKEVVEKTIPVQDNWLVLSIKTEPLDTRLRMEKIWLYGQENQQFAHLLSFYANQQITKAIYLVDSVISASVQYYPGIDNSRALVKKQTATVTSFTPTGIASFDDLFNSISKKLANNPFARELPFLMDKVSVRYTSEGCYLQDILGHAVPLKNDPTQAWEIMAASLGQPITAFIIYDNQQFTLLSILRNGALIAF